MEGDVITLQDVFIFDHSAGLRRERQAACGRLSATGLRPKFLEKLAHANVQRRPDAVRAWTVAEPMRCGARSTPGSSPPALARPRPSLLAGWRPHRRPPPRAASTTSRPRTASVQVALLAAGVPDGATPDLGSAARSTLDGTPVDADGRARLGRHRARSSARRSWRSTSATAWRPAASSTRPRPPRRPSSTSCPRRPLRRHRDVRRRRSTVAQKPTLDRAASKSRSTASSCPTAPSSTTASTQAVDAPAATRAPRSVLVLSDGRDTVDDHARRRSPRPSRRPTSRSTSSPWPSPPATRRCSSRCPTPGGGQVISADDPTALGRAVRQRGRRRSPSRSWSPRRRPAGAARRARSTVSVDAGGEPYTDDAFVTLPPRADRARPPATPSRRRSAPVTAASTSPGSSMLGRPRSRSRSGSLVLLVIALRRARQEAGRGRDRSIEAYTRKGAQAARGRAASAAARRDRTGRRRRREGPGEQARASRPRSATGSRRPGMALKPAEWLLLHAGIAVGAAPSVVLLIGGGNLLFAAGRRSSSASSGPWIYLGLKQSRRLQGLQRASSPTPCS